MDELTRAIEAILAAGPGRILLSGPRAGRPYRRATLRPLGAGWQVERLTGTQAFHENIGAGALAATVAKLLAEDFTQLTATAAGREHSLKLTKKGRVLQTGRPLAPKAGPRPAVTTGANTAPAPAPAKAPGPPAEAARPPQGVAPQGAPPATGGTSTTPHGTGPTPPFAGPAHGPAHAPTHGRPSGHDRPKRRLIPEGADIPALYDLGIFTPEGRVVAAKQDKFRQINRFVELVADALPSPLPQSLRVVDFGCGKSALTFILYHYLAHSMGIPTRMTGLDLRRDVVESCAAAARKYGYQTLDFAIGDIADYAADGPVDMVVALHACDTATDHALAKAVAWGAQAILCVPCCQHELAGQMQSEALALLCRYGLVKERAAALMTDAIRANLLAACGYKTRLVEFVEPDATPKNTMLRAQKAGMPAAQRRRALAEVDSLCAAFGLNPCLRRLLAGQGRLPLP